MASGGGDDVTYCPRDCRLGVGGVVDFVVEVDLLEYGTSLLKGLASEVRYDNTLPMLGIEVKPEDEQYDEHHGDDDHEHHVEKPRVSVEELFL